MKVLGIGPFLRYPRSMERSRKKTAIALVAALALALVPASALAEPGSDQYCDPFGGCGTDPGGQTGGGSKGKGKDQASPQQVAQIISVLESQSLNQKQRAAALAGADAAVVERYRAALRDRQAQKVLEAAGLSALRSTVSHR